MKHRLTAVGAQDTPRHTLRWWISDEPRHVPTRPSPTFLWTHNLSFHHIQILHILILHHQKQ
ncbi:hypothetical protein E2C01_035245 [Portunus trituberculatus]|uniref:Uncharacterized protein n=1 Tax=Portunus trituberculatus TaxID=210409 RepID=A0A5B7FAY8_PORTR|nr:hypothetical protein [Portunus trituberculatus]